MTETVASQGAIGVAKQSEHSKVRILIVDDEHSLALTLKAILQHHGYEADTAFSGEEAIAKSATFVPDLLLTDIRMGGMNGIEAAKVITAKLPKCKVLFLSGHIAVSLDQLNNAQGFRFEFASKPVPPTELVKRVAEMLASANTYDHVVLTVLHDDILRYAIVTKLAEAGFIVREARNGAEALNVIQGSTLAQTLADAGFIVTEVGTAIESETVPNKPDAMVLDVASPDNPGFEVHRTIVKVYPEMARVPVVYLAPTHQLSEAKIEASALALAKVIALPVEPSHVVSTLKGLLKIDNGTQLTGQPPAS